MNQNELLKEKKISFLATGSEIIFGDLQESNCYRFSKSVSENGGEIYQHVHTSDRKNEIISAIEYLLLKSDAIVITGGLGPTSDDNTRFAVAEYIQEELYFDEKVWENIYQRLKLFHLPMTASNKQQALFPKGSVLYPNKNGSAYGFHVKSKGKYIFALPGPPRECTPLFEEYIIPVLAAENFLNKKSISYWTTLGLIESEIAAKIDELAKSHPVETGYRWHYPYLDIKIISDRVQCVKELSEKIDLLLEPNFVSYDQKNAIQILEELTEIPDIYVIDNITSGELKDKIRHEKLIFIPQKNAQKEHENTIEFIVEASKSFDEKSEYSGTIAFSCTGFVRQGKQYSHSISVPYRSKEVFNYAKHYVAWQLSKFILTLNRDRDSL